jgi:hypothetical protein
MKEQNAVAGSQNGHKTPTGEKKMSIRSGSGTLELDGKRHDKKKQKET